MLHTAPTRFQETRYLLLDDRIIDEVVAAKLTLGEVTKHPQNPLFGEDKPWEPRFDNVYANVIYDFKDRLYKCWYNPFIVDERVTHTPPEKRHPDFGNYMDMKPNRREMGPCYAFEELILTIEKEIHAELQGQLGKSIPDTQIGRDILKQVSEKMMEDIKEKILAELQAQFGEGFLKV